MAGFLHLTDIFGMVEATVDSPKHQATVFSGPMADGLDQSRLDSAGCRNPLPNSLPFRISEMIWGGGNFHV